MKTLDFASQFKIYYLLLFPLLQIGCQKNVTQLVGTELKVKGLAKVATDGVRFSLFNASKDTLAVESTEQLYIETRSNETWQLVPYVPCACGTPCRPPMPAILYPGQQLEIRWNLTIRQCEPSEPPLPPKNIESKATPGTYRMTFVVNRSLKGMRTTPEKLVVKFKIK
jgi:hypothetical protein